MKETWLPSLGQEGPLEKGMATKFFVETLAELSWQPCGRGSVFSSILQFRRWNNLLAHIYPVSDILQSDSSHIYAWSAVTCCLPRANLYSRSGIRGWSPSRNLAKMHLLLLPGWHKGLEPFAGGYCELLKAGFFASSLTWLCTFMRCSRSVLEEHMDDWISMATHNMD